MLSGITDPGRLDKSVEPIADFSGIIICHHQKNNREHDDGYRNSEKFKLVKKIYEVSHEQRGTPHKEYVLEHGVSYQDICG